LFLPSNCLHSTNNETSVQANLCNQPCNEFIAFFA
jgi:hypothetical protein